MSHPYLVLDEVQGEGELVQVEGARLADVDEGPDVGEGRLAQARVDQDVPHIPAPHQAVPGKWG